MSTDPESMLGRLQPRGAPAELRERVLGAVARELAPRAGAWREWRWAGAVAAGIFLGVALNIWAVRNIEGRLAGLYGPPAVPRPVVEVAEAVASVTDAETAHWVQQRLVAAHREYLRSVPFSPSFGTAAPFP